MADLATLLREIEEQVARIMTPKHGTTPLTAATIAAMLKGNRT